MEESFTVSKQSTRYYQNTQQNYYNLARVRQRNSVLDRMQQQYETYTFNNSGEIFNDNINNINNNDNINNNNLEQANINKNNQTNSNNTNSSPLNNILKNLNLSNLSSLLGGKGDFSNIILNLLNKENNEIGSIIKLMQNPLIKNTFSKKHNKAKVATNSGDKINSKSEIDNYEKIET